MLLPESRRSKRRQTARGRATRIDGGISRTGLFQLLLDEGCGLRDLLDSLFQNFKPLLDIDWIYFPKSDFKL